MSRLVELSRLIGSWYDALDLRRMHNAEYRAREINRLAKLLEAVI